MKILILVLSFNEEPFSTLMRTQQNSWDAIEVEGVDTVYYYGGGKGWNGKEFSAKSDDKYYYMHDKLKQCLQGVMCSTDWTLIFRTNSSSYVNKSALLEFAKTLPTEKLYAGWTMIDSEDHGGLVVSGAGIFMSRDVAEILRDKIDPTFEQEEDIYCGRILRKQGIVALDDKSRYDVESNHDYIPLDRYHYRFKTGNRIVDAHNMVMLHKKIISEQ